MPNAIANDDEYMPQGGPEKEMLAPKSFGDDYSRAHLDASENFMNRYTERRMHIG